MLSIFQFYSDIHEKHMVSYLHAYRPSHTAVFPTSESEQASGREDESGGESYGGGYGDRDSHAVLCCVYRISTLVVLF